MNIITNELDSKKKKKKRSFHQIVLYTVQVYRWEDNMYNVHVLDWVHLSV